MKNFCIRLHLFAILVLALLAPPSTNADSEAGRGFASSTFSYQGRLEENGAPMNGTVDMFISLFDAPTGPQKIGPGELFSSVPVVNGEFTIEYPILDIAYDGTPRWLEIEVGPPGGTRTTLSPRRPLHEAPMATFADVSTSMLNNELFLERLTMAEDESTAEETSLPSLPISDAAPTTDTINIPTHTPFSDRLEMALLLSIEHTYVSDLTITLTSPEGTSITLFEALGGDGDNIFAEFSTVTPDPINGESPFNQSGWDAQVGSLNDFRGENIGGDWTLSITDSFADDEGTLVGWQILFTTLPAIRFQDGSVLTRSSTDPFGRTTLPRELNLGNGPLNMKQSWIHLFRPSDLANTLFYNPDIEGPVLTSSSNGTMGPIGFDGVLNPAIFWTSNAFVGIANAVPTNHPFVVGPDGNTTMGNGAHVTGGGTWTNGSSRTWKENFRELDTLEILNRLVAMPITRWDYTGSEEGSHIGPVAEDFHAAFGTGDNEKYISTVDADGVAFAAIQALNTKLEQMHSENERLRRENDEMRRRQSEFERRLRRIEERGASGHD